METEFSSRSMTYLSGRVISYSLQKKFSKLLQSLPENLQHTQWRMNRTRLTAVIFHQSRSESFNNGLVYIRVGFKCICATNSRQYTELFYKLYARATESGRSIFRLQFQKYPTHQRTKMSRRENLYFLTTNFQSRQNSTIWNLVFTLPLWINLKPWTLSFKKDTNTVKIV